MKVVNPIMEYFIVESLCADFLVWQGALSCCKCTFLIPKSHYMSKYCFLNVGVHFKVHLIGNNN